MQHYIRHIEAAVVSDAYHESFQEQCTMQLVHYGKIRNESMFPER